MYSGPWRTVPPCTNHVDQTPAKEDLGQLSPKHLAPATRAAHGTGGAQRGRSSPYISARAGCLFRADQSLFPYSELIPGAPAAWEGQGDPVAFGA